MALQSGVYVANNQKKVTHWNAPDWQGDGDEVWVDQVDANGNMTGRMRAVDANNRPIRSYLPPEGFANKPSFDHTDNYVRVDGRGVIQRNAKGEAIGIRPGATLIEYADGSYELLEDDYSRYVFEQTHSPVSDSDVFKAPAPQDTVVVS